ncbi:MAG: hypothetical protein KDA85_10910 [Planctomycetaceae bacterium]|nr:hypothetical protein [Planctomycetaceae bacterium]
MSQPAEEESWGQDPFHPAVAAGFGGYGDQQPAYGYGGQALPPSTAYTGGSTNQGVQRSFPWKWMIVIGLLCFFLSAAGMGVWLFGGTVMDKITTMLPGGSSEKEDLALLPAETTMVAFLDLEAIEQQEAAIARFGAMPGNTMMPPEVKPMSRVGRSVLIAVPGTVFNGTPQMLSQQSPFMVMRLKKSYTEETLQQEAGLTAVSSQTIEGRTIYRQGRSSVCLLEPQLLIFGPAADVEEVLKGRRNNQLISEMALPGGSGQFAFCFRMTDQLRERLKMMPAPPAGGAPELQDIATIYTSLFSLRQVSGRIGVAGSTQTFHIEMRMQEAEQASRVSTAIQSLLNRQQADASFASGFLSSAGFLNGYSPSGFRVSSSGDRVVLSGQKTEP